MGYVTRRKWETRSEAQSTICRPIQVGKKDVNALLHKRKPRKNLTELRLVKDKGKRGDVVYA